MSARQRRSPTSSAISVDETMSDCGRSGPISTKARRVRHEGLCRNVDNGLLTVSTHTEKLVRGKRLAAVVYALQAAAPFIGITYPIGAAISHLQRPRLAGTWLESHFRWQINTFWISLGISVVGVAALSLGPIGTMILAGDLMWIVYRIVQGWTRLNGEKPVGPWSADVPQP